MVASPSIRYRVMTWLSTAIFAAGFVLSTHFIAGGQLFGVLFAVPLIMISWCWGLPGGLIAAASGIIFMRVAFSAEYFLIRGNHLDLFWLMSALETSLVFLVIGAAVGKLSDSLRELKRAAQATQLAEQQLQVSHSHLEAVLQAVPDLMFEVDREGRLYGPVAFRTPPSVVGMVKDFLPSEAASASMRGIATAAKMGKQACAQYRVVLEGEERWFEQSVSPIGDHRPNDAHFILLARDITERMRHEDQVSQTGKMEAVGRLAGGIAHDFNNILQAIMGFCDLIRDQIGNDAEVLRSVGMIDESAERAAALTHQLLAFSRKQMIQPVVRDLNHFLRTCEGLIKQTVGDRIELSLRTQEKPIWVSVDPAQLQHVFVNLAANARDSVPGTGKLAVEAQRVQTDVDLVGAPSDLPAGHYALLSVRDTGIGMDSATLSHIFEPFFTTKDVGQGSGLGLSIVYGTIRQMGGFISVDSVVGLGTCFRIFFPLVEDASRRAPATPAEMIAGISEDSFSCAREAGTVLLMSRDGSLRAMIALGLRAAGYTVIEALEREEAMGSARVHAERVDLVLADGGFQGIEEIMATFPKARVIMMTDSVELPGQVQETFGAQAAALCKPFGLTELQSLMRKVLGPARP